MTSERFRPHDLGFGELFARIRDAVIVADAKTQRIVLWNPAAEKMFGYSTSEALELPAVRKNGKEISVELSLSPISPVHEADRGEGQFVLAIIRDVTRRKQAEEAIQQLNKDLENRVKERTSQLEATIAELEGSQQKLRESEKRFRLLVEDVKDYA